MSGHVASESGLGARAPTGNKPAYSGPSKRHSELPTLDLVKESNRKPMKFDPSWVDRSAVAGSLSKVVASSGMPLSKFLH